MTTAYTVSVSREGRWWMVAVPELDVLTQARHIGEAEQMAREVIALHTGQEVDDIEIDMQVG